MQVRTVAAIMAWIVVGLLLLNGMIRSQWVTIVSIALTAVAVLLYFSPRWTKNKESQNTEPESAKNSIKQQ